MSRLLADRDGTTHVALQANGDDAWWTPILCGEGINLPGPQKHGNPSCPECQRRLTAQDDDV
jgi:hypothetical protein